ncbi:23S rRNA (guanosine(2251)-2'-O)-methyltransferase RlmB [Adlercreutzia sp. ZJ242]|uniref:23S rRNA (guanosine(2251)-2'-O)-methyltransferase RlmB n=1 Tax=Adlercreutzia sp. ZJ242 TaxID=2709409 RepID=UPI0013EB3BC6|nr:23S rRNA (guanosine(2251)-2'-O)-methyltransferase RlmB [Adlercreutzia sp. ZJ242]
MADYIEGKRPVVEALRTHVPVKRILMADNVQRDGLITDILRKARNLDVPVTSVPRKKLDELSDHGSHQGVVAEAKPFEYVNVTAVLKAAQRSAEEHGGRALVVVLDHITDAGNLGAIARSAESVGAAGIVIPNKRAARVTAATYKSSAGAIAHIPVTQVANISSCLERLKKEGFWVAAATEHAADYIWDANLKGKIALVFGNEGEGVSSLVLGNCDFGVKLPQVGDISSLNVAQASTACMYEWLRQNRTAAEGLRG